MNVNVCGARLTWQAEHPATHTFLAQPSAVSHGNGMLYTAPPVVLAEMNVVSNKHSRQGQGALVGKWCFPGQ